MILNHMCFILASNRVLKSERAVHLVAIKAENLMWCTCSRILDRTIFSPALIFVAGTQLSLFTSQPCGFFGGGGGGGGRICFRQSLAKDGAARSHVLHPVIKLDAKQAEDRDKVFMQLPTRIYLTAALNIVTTHC